MNQLGSPGMGSWVGHLMVLALFILNTASQIHVGTLCNKHEDCIRYCSYSRHGIEGASCCLPEKIRVSRSNWMMTGSSTCYCCPIPEINFPGKRTTEIEFDTTATGVTTNNNSLSIQERDTNNEVVLGGVNYCEHFLLSESSEPDSNEGMKFHEEDVEIGGDATNLDVTKEFCTNKCVQVMINMKIGFEFPSLCRARGNKRQ